ncbi:unnamed protein product [Rotaria sp. Silwood2]|nr:unnamed protein product [Rotaria sp. Silwood2]CAF2545477.1 unnamed protein product [Rotaria sp. Silwood2]CAF2955526.1 unnamed protein product [Rotaria sp. Silwood2]CAF3964522.1 unnamed protein product [Rotaria sp. Silwood2]CAF4131626.1 unnamed protein product [Rotaria sp. Silwood2]
MTLFAYRLVVVLFLFISQVYGSCYFDLLKSSSSNNSSGNQIIDKYCEYFGKKYAINTNWTSPFPDCLHCQCADYGLECCGFGIQAGPNIPPAGCEVVLGICEVQFVRTDDSSQACNDSGPVNPKRLQKKFIMRRKNSTIIHKKKSGFILN